MIEKIKKVHGPYIRKEDGRKHVVVMYKDGSKRTVSYPKFLVEYVLDRELDPIKETVDHIDKNFENNFWNNLRIIAKGKHIEQDSIRVELVKTNCVWCGNEIIKRPSEYNGNRSRGKAGPFCSKSCSGIYGTSVQHHKLEQFPIQKRRKSKYFKPDKNGGIKVSDIIKSNITEQDILNWINKDKNSVKKLKKKPLKGSKKRINKKSQETSNCPDCRKSRRGRCRKCAALATPIDKRRKVLNRPSLETLLMDRSKLTLQKIGKKYGVSGASIRKWIKEYELNTLS